MDCKVVKGTGAKANDKPVPFSSVDHSNPEKQPTPFNIAGSAYSVPGDV